jgi:hypothetical protein
MYVLLSYQTAPVTECSLYTLHKNIDVHQYVCVDGLSEYFLELMHYYALYKSKGAHQYVFVDGFSDCSLN